jgi:hypothetical protein
MSYPHFDYRIGSSLTPHQLAQAQANYDAQRAFRSTQRKSKSGVPIVPLKKDK